MRQFETMYQVLGVEPTATRSEIQAAGRKHQLKFHTDKGGSIGNAQILNEVIALLSNEVVRARYDSALTEMRPPQAYGVARAIAQTLEKEENARRQQAEEARVAVEEAARIKAEKEASRAAIVAGLDLENLAAVTASLSDRLAAYAASQDPTISSTQTKASVAAVAPASSSSSAPTSLPDIPPKVESLADRLAAALRSQNVRTDDGAPDQSLSTDSTALPPVIVESVVSTPRQSNADGYEADADIGDNPAISPPPVAAMVVDGDIDPASPPTSVADSSESSVHVRRASAAELASSSVASQGSTVHASAAPVASSAFMLALMERRGIRAVEKKRLVYNFFRDYCGAFSGKQKLEVIDKVLRFLQGTNGANERFTVHDYLVLTQGETGKIVLANKTFWPQNLLDIESEAKKEEAAQASREAAHLSSGPTF